MENKRKSYVYKITCNITGEYYFGGSYAAKTNASKKRTGENASFYGRHHSAESKKKISLSSQGEHNGMFGHKHTIFSINKIKKRWELVKSGKRYHKGYTEKHFPELVDILKNQKLDC